MRPADPRRLDPNDLAPADLFDRMHPPQEDGMTLHGTITTRDRTCENDTAEGVSLAAVQQWTRDANALAGRVQEAAAGKQAPSDAAVARAEALYLALRTAATDPRLLVVGPCGFTGEAEGEIVSGTRAGWTEQWTCPRCGHDNTDSLDGE